MLVKKFPSFILLLMPSDRTKYYAGYYEQNRAKKLAYQNAYYERMKGHIKGNKELMDLLEPEEAVRKRQKYLDYQKHYRQMRRQKVNAVKPEGQ